MNIETDSIFALNGAITENHPCFMQFHQNPTIKGEINYVNPRYGYYEVRGFLDNPYDPKYQCMANIRRMADGSVTQIIRDPSIVVKEPNTKIVPMSPQPTIYEQRPENVMHDAKVGVGRYEVADQEMPKMRKTGPKMNQTQQADTKENFTNVSKSKKKEGFCSVPKSYEINEGFCGGPRAKEFVLDRPEAEANLVVKEPFCGPQVFSEYDTFGINLRPNCMYSATGKLECDKPHIFNQDRKVACRYY
jgi:hypothetical protein